MMVRRTIASGIVCCLLIIPLLPNGSAHAAGFWSWNCESNSLVDFWGAEIEGSELSGHGTVCATTLGLWSTMRVRGLTPGNAYTVWWVYVDDPTACADFPLPSPDIIPFPEPADFAGRCGLADFFTPDASGEFTNPLAVFGRMDSVVAGTRPYTRFAGDLRSFKPSPGSQVWMLIFGHGPAADGDKRELARQLLTPEDPGSGAPHLGIEGRPFGYPVGVVVMEMP